MRFYYKYSVFRKCGDNMATANVIWSSKRAQIPAVSTIITTTDLHYVKTGHTLMIVHLDLDTRFNIHVQGLLLLPELLTR